ncbi:MFS transporter [Govanella unica]|uniref:MFS transporter n=1 Tax=Govanella unica TaxID=2975056 RepID=A0A9X3TZ88_9PROT|nr:MFS transporter [Govania unica]MDA5194533.1 MFS transporter [Govania unica]
MVKTSLPATRFYGWYVVGLLALAHLVSFIDRFLMSLVLVPLKQDFNLTDTELGLLHGTGFAILYAVAAIPLGHLADISHRRNLIVGGLLVWSAATAACGLSGDFPTLFAARIGVGLGEAALVPAAMLLITAYIHRDHLARAVSVFTSGAVLGHGVALIGGGAVLAWLVSQNGLTLPYFGVLRPWQGLFVLAAIPGLVLAVVMFTIREPMRASRTKPRIGAALDYAGGHRMAYGTHFLAAACVIALVQSFAAWAPTFYVRFFDMTVAQSGWTVGLLVLITGVSGNLSGGFLTDRLHKMGLGAAPGVVIMGMVLLAVPCAILFCTTRVLSLSLVAYGALNFCLSAASPAGLAGVQMLTPSHLRGVISAAFLCIITFFAVGLGPLMIGVVTDRVFGDEQALYLSLLSVSIVLSIIGVGAAGLGRRSTSRAYALVTD